MKVVQSKSNKKYEKVRQDVEAVSHKLKEQCVAWQKRLSDMDSLSKNLLSKEQVHRCNIVQQQLDRTSAVEGQLMEIIEGLEVMNYELEDKVKSAKKAKRKAIRLYDKSKEAASRCLDQLQVEKEQKSLLKDELTHSLKAQQAQENQLTEYKAMVETFKSTKQSFTREVKIGHSRGARWHLWVTKVCCELLVNGSLPLAIPSSIDTLFATLYGKEPKKILLLSYVCQCRVLIQIVSETITAMKLAVCPTWAEIFFDATMQRQVPFLAVVISLMGDGPESINPIIVSLRIVLEDETSETQVDGIVSKLRAAIKVHSY